MRERNVEAYLGREVRKIGGRSVKFISTEAGVPDRLIMLPGGKMFLVEVKAPGGRIRPVQRVWHERAAKRGVHVVLLTSTAEVDDWIKEVTS